MPSGSLKTLSLTKEIKKMKFTTQSLDTFWNDYAPLAVGLDEMVNRLNSMHNTVNVNYPPYNIVKHDNSNYTVEVALAGFKPEEIEVFTEQNVLTIASKVEERDTTRQYVHKGLSKRSFTRKIQLSDEHRVSSVDFQHGLLTVDIERIIPEHQKKTTWSIPGASSDPKFLTEDRDSNFPGENTIN
jgi:molecular chaperone IbpA